MNSLTATQKAQKKGRDSYSQKLRLPGIMGDIFSDIMPGLSPKKTGTPRNTHGRTVTVAQKKGARH